ncbi:uncharacterized protein J3R85_017142 [Psidium guajava]|nr:uncharacterized protein J3R85_017142 [Psidium guajava]
MTTWAAICSCPILSSDFAVAPPLPSSSSAKPPLSASGAPPAPNTVPLPSSAALKLPFSELLLLFSCSPPASFLVPLSLFALAPATGRLCKLQEKQ